jgi:hypothetical protein
LRAAPWCIAATLALGGCIDFSGLDELSAALGPTLEGISVWAVRSDGGPDSNVVAVGDTLRVAAAGKVGGVVGLFTYDRLLDAAWSTSHPSVATVEPRLPPAGDSTTTAQAVVRGLRPGVLRVRAAARGKLGELQLRVVQRTPGT